jgi:hypothetical protein
MRFFSKALTFLAGIPAGLSSGSLNAFEHYCGMYDVKPVVMAQLCEDLQRTEVEDARIESGKMDITKLHWTLNFLFMAILYSLNAHIYGTNEQTQSLILVGFSLVS